MESPITILAIESSCDDTSAAVMRDGCLLSNVIASQSIHEAYGGVVPELASRAHQQNIVPVIHEAIRRAGIDRREISAVAVTQGPGLLGSLMVGFSFAKGFSQSLGIPFIEINHLQAHVLSAFIQKPDIQQNTPDFPFLCLLVSGGNSQIVLVRSPYEMEIVGKTIDDAAGEAFDKCAKVMGLPYPGGPYIDKFAKNGNPDAFAFSKPHIDGFDYSFSGLKTSFLYLLRDKIMKDADFVQKNLNDLCASLQKTIITILLDKLQKAAKYFNINQFTLSGGVSANSALRTAMIDFAKKHRGEVFLPPLEFTTDNAAMVAVTGYYKFLKDEFAKLDAVPYARNFI